MPVHLLAREDLPGTSTPGSNGGGGGVTLPLLLGVVIGGGILLFICLAFLLIALAGRRHRAAQARSAQCSPRSGDEAGCASEADGSPRAPSPRPRRLTKAKAKPTTYMDMVEIREQHPHRSLVSIMGLARSKTFSVFGAHAEAAGGHQRGGNLRRNNSWIDEDAIHGPRVLRDDRTLCIRDSFILRTPTLPDFSTFKEGEAFADGQFGRDQQQQYIQRPRPVSMPAQWSGQPPRIPLPRTASYELAEKLAAAARGGVPPSPQGPRLAPMPVPMPRLRHKTTESDLAEILRSTEERLQNGTPSNSRPATRQRANSASAGSSMMTPRGSPTKSCSPVKISGSPLKTSSPIRTGSPVRPARSPSRSQSPVKHGSPVKNMMINHVGQTLGPLAQNRTRTPSPSKKMVVPVLVQTPVHPHRRNTSQSSLVSDADSLFGETTPDAEHVLKHVLPTGLSSPSRRSDNESAGNGNKPADRCTSMRSLGSNASSSLSTLYSVNDPEDDCKTGGKGEGLVRGRKPKGLTIDTAICDPFVTPPLVPPRSPKRQASSLPPLRRISPPEEMPMIDVPFNSRSASNSPIPRPLDVIKRSSTADGSPMRLSVMMHSPGLGASPEAIRPKSVASMKPVFLVSSNSVVSMKASPGTSPEDDNHRPERPNNRSTFGQKPIFPPPLNLRPGQGSPNREALVMRSPEGSVSIMGGNAPPALRTITYSRESSPSTSPTRRPLPNRELKNELRRGSPTLGRYQRRGMASPIRERVLSRQPTHQRDNRADLMLSSSDCPSIVLKPSDSPKWNSLHREFAVTGLQSTVAQLRRMNSQMSTLSGASSVSDPDSPTLPKFRGGGFSPDRSNSRVSKTGRQNYLSLGMSPRAQRNTIKGARNSIAVIRSRPGAARLDGLRAAVEEKEDEAGTSDVIEGPRPVNPTPRSAGRGRPMASTGMMGSPTRRPSGMFEGEKAPDVAEGRAEKAKQQGEALGRLVGLETQKHSPRKASDGVAAGDDRNSSPLRL